MPTPPHRPRWSLRGVADASLWVGLAGAFGLCLLTLSGFAGERHWLLEITTHFRPHYAGGLLVFAAIYACARRFRMAAAFAAFALLNIAVLLPRFDSRPPVPADAPSLKLLLANVHTDNRDYAALLELISREQPDIIALLEVNDTWLDAVARLEKTHPYFRKVSRSDNFGIALYSRIPLGAIRTAYLSAAEIPSIQATVTLGTNRSIRILATHPLPPGDAGNVILRDQQLAAIAGWSTGSTSPALVIGDLNCTPWSPAFRRLLADGSLQDTGRGITPTWPVKPWFLRIPLDHCLTSPSILTKEHRVGPDIGSDHFPVIVTVALP
ncbi:MAG TPA: endonuclease/exonuclease/phosphatase family protein [Rariglobus sp.]|nr:endonuclease/exonuclease/phosphatase family protein [Rariglobus sp.]